MKDSFDVCTDIMSLFNVEPILTMINVGVVAGTRTSGGTGIYSDAFPSTDKKFINIVVNSLGVTNEAFQKASANVNVHIPVIASGRPDVTKLRPIVKALIPYLEHQNRATFQTSLNDGGTLLQDTDGSWFYNIPVDYYSIQEQYYNV